MELLSLESSTLSVPLIEPFVIASGTMIATRSVMLRARVRAEGGEATGLGEAAALPPVTDCDQPDLLRDAALAAEVLPGLVVDRPEALAEMLAERIPCPVLRAGIEAAILDAWARSQHRSVVALLCQSANASGPAAASAAAAAGLQRHTFSTDITIPIADPAHMAELARLHHASGFSVFKVKVGRDLDADVAALRAIADAVPAARFRIDANGGYDLAGARTLLREAEGLTLECFEQPCARGDDGAAIELTRTSRVPIVADESLRSLADLEHLKRVGAAHGVNLKLVKLGGLVRAFEVGARARASGLSLMCGAMVETRLGLSAMLHVAAALGGADWVDLDTQLLLTHEVFEGGYEQRGPAMELTLGHGLGVKVLES